MKKQLLTVLCLLCAQVMWAQGEYKGKFEQLGETLPTPNVYRTGAGAPGPQYWQQQADYVIDVTVDDATQKLTGSETITYHNNSPSTLGYVWLQMDQNMRATDSDTPKVTPSSNLRDSIPAKFAYNISGADDYDGGFKVMAVSDAEGKPLTHIINKTMMRVELPQPLAPGQTFTFKVKWWFNINDRMIDGGRGGLEYFPEDDNFHYTIAQWFPRMCVFDDYQGWQNKQFLGRGEFALVFGNYKVNITVPSDHIVGATGWLQNPKDVLTKDQIKRFEKAKQSFDAPVIIATQAEAEEREKQKATTTKTWTFHADNVRDFAFTTSRKLIWDAQAVNINGKTPLAMSFYPKEGNPLWEKESTPAVARTLITYSKHTIDYPYPVAISVHAASIGMEYPMICFNYGRPDKDGTYTDRLKWGMIGVIIHEVGHNFFPMIINSDERQWTWMDEGLNSFTQHLTEREWYPEKPVTRGTPATITNYMKGDKQYIRPIMTNSEQILQFGNNAYSKPSAALVLLRETIMGPELFDYSYQEYAKRWAFKHPNPADFFRTMEDASGVDLDWFWKGWFYTTDNVDVSIENVEWFKFNGNDESFENKPTAKKGDVTSGEDKAPNTEAIEPPTYLSLVDTDARYYGEFQARMTDAKIRESAAKYNFYQVKFKNIGGLVTPLQLEWTYADGTTETEMLAAEIWRSNENEVTKTFRKEKEVVSVTFDPKNDLADTDVENNTFPRTEVKSKFDEHSEDN